jgi:transcriptional regulator with XRE-family HTH domain
MIIMSDKSAKAASAPPIGHQIRRLRLARGWTLAELARRAGTSAPALHRYENGWDRFRLATLRRIATALGSRVVLQLEPLRRAPGRTRAPSPRALLECIAPLFWDRELQESDLEGYPAWVLGRVLMFGQPAQVRAARRYFGDDAIRRAIERRGVDARTRAYWRFLLGGVDHAPESPRR